MTDGYLTKCYKNTTNAGKHSREVHALPHVVPRLLQLGQLSVLALSFPVQLSKVLHFFYEAERDVTAWLPLHHALLQH